MRAARLHSFKQPRGLDLQGTGETDERGHVRVTGSL
jgi:hypothetical protein